ncbi:GNAT family protein [uncultured Tenacibaculum sp.]|uniref:GNAT family N-acetyltransferase n=1 Tax=uncultured Tenacibaculum sp. TaxID=174713 RepID=UPI00261DDE32|nr:GNAT family protein [uncultured Tenacibaculum sp.]
MIQLKPLLKEHVVPFYTWINDDEVIKYSLPLFLKIKTKEEIDAWYVELLKDTELLNLGIFLEDTGQLIGYAGICNISRLNKSGEYYIFIGEKSFWGKGIAKVVTKEIVHIGFNKYDLNRIFLTVSEPNIGGVKAYEKAGFKYEGNLREACFRGGKFHDKIIMSVLKSEWEG